jgi:exosome complex protein LRP1
LQRAEQQAKERARSHIKFEELSKKRKAENVAEKLQSDANDSDPSDSCSDSDSDVVTDEMDEFPVAHAIPTKRRKVDKALTINGQNKSLPTSEVSRDSSASEKKKREKEA